MGKTKLKPILALLTPEKAALLKELSADTRIARTVLMREAIDDLLVKYKKLKLPKRKP